MTFTRTHWYGLGAALALVMFFGPLPLADRAGFAFGLWTVLTSCRLLMQLWAVVRLAIIRRRIAAIRRECSR